MTVSLAHFESLGEHGFSSQYEKMYYSQIKKTRGTYLELGRWANHGDSVWFTPSEVYIPQLAGTCADKAGTQHARAALQ